MGSTVSGVVTGEDGALICVQPCGTQPTPPPTNPPTHTNHPHNNTSAPGPPPPAPAPPAPSAPPKVIENLNPAAAPIEVPKEIRAEAPPPTPSGITGVVGGVAGGIPGGSIGGVPGGQFLDSTGAPKVGYCTCQLPNAAGMRTWTCASDTSWPCPSGLGCGPGAKVDGGGAAGACAPTVLEGAACGPADQQACFKPCEPGQTGVNALGCINGVYMEMSSCAFPPG